MAALIKQELGLEADIEPGGRGEFTVWYGDVKIAEKTRTGFPSETAIVDALRQALE